MKRTKKNFKLTGCFLLSLCLHGFLNAAEYCEYEPDCKEELYCCPCTGDFHIFAGLLVWTAREAGADVWAEAIVSTPSSISNDLRQVDFGWDLGFRVGAGFSMLCPALETKIYYTRFHTRGKDSASRGPGSMHSTFLGNFYVDNPLGLGISGPSYESASIDWTIDFNMFDLELGRNLCVGRCLSLYPFVGIKGGWIDQSIRSKWKNPDLPDFLFFELGVEKVTNDFVGVGPAVGVYTKWTLFSCKNQCFSLFGDFSGALMWGHWSFSDEFTNDLNQEVTIELQTINSGASMVRTFMGFEWDLEFTSGCYGLSAKLGWESQFWLNQLQFYSFTGGRLDNQLTLQGGLLEFCFDF